MTNMNLVIGRYVAISLTSGGFVRGHINAIYGDSAMPGAIEVITDENNVVLVPWVAIAAVRFGK